MSQGANVKIEGVKQTVTALKAFEPDLHKAMNKEIRAQLSRVRDRAKAKYPAGSWSINLNQKAILGRIAATAGGGGWSNPWRSLSKATPGTRSAVLEFIGSSYDGSDPSVRGLIETLNSRYGQPGRFLWSSWDELGGEVLENIKAAVEAAERDLQGKLDAAGEGY